ncbi:MAG: SHOCT domain-containing protein [Actinobacteria bacterium]|nr:SHOCT domain-containing protein [Actinomycetota bacterium]
MPHWGFDGGSWWFFWIMMLSMIFFWAIVVIGIIILVRWLAVSPGRVPEQRAADRSLQVLRERYARGEISKEDYERMKRDLS